MALAPRRVQSVPDCLSRDPMMVLHPASITPESMKRCCPRKMEQRMRRRCAKSIPLRCGSAGSAGRPDSVRHVERVTGRELVPQSRPGQEAAGARLSNLRTALKSGRISGWYAPSSVWRSQSKSRDSTISLPSGSRTACSGVRPPRTGIFW